MYNVLRKKLIYYEKIRGLNILLFLFSVSFIFVTISTFSLYFHFDFKRQSISQNIDSISFIISTFSVYLSFYLENLFHKISKNVYIFLSIV